MPQKTQKQAPLSNTTNQALFHQSFTTNLAPVTSHWHHTSIKPHLLKQPRPQADLITVCLPFTAISSRIEISSTPLFEPSSITELTFEAISINICNRPQDLLHVIIGQPKHPPTRSHRSSRLNIALTAMISLETQARRSLILSDSYPIKPSSRAGSRTHHQIELLLAKPAPDTTNGGVSPLVDACIDGQPPPLGGVSKPVICLLSSPIRARIW